MTAKAKLGDEAEEHDVEVERIEADVDGVLAKVGDVLEPA